MITADDHEIDPDLLVRATALATSGYGPLAIPAGCKQPPPTGTTGHDPIPTLAQWYASVQADPNRTNLGVRLPPEVVGVDVDAYDEKGGRAVWETLNEGDRLPLTVVVSARFEPGYDGLSGIRLYRLPLAVGESDLWGAHDGVEIIRYGHRYLMAPGSLHPSGTHYRGLDVRTREFIDVLPRPEDLPELSEAQAMRLTRAGAPWARKAPPSPQTPAPVGMHRDTHERLPEAPSRPGEICSFLERQVQAAETRLRSGSSRHDTMTEAMWSILSAQAEGHNGGGDAAILRVAEVFYQEVTADGTRTPEEARAELRRSYDQARSKIVPVDPMLQACCGHLLVPGSSRDTPSPAQEGIWEATAWLAWCDRTGKARGVSRWALVGALLARVSAEISPEVKVDSPLGDGVTELNLFCFLLGGSGTGKSLANRTIRSAWAWSSNEIRLGSGEGLAAAYVKRESSKDEMSGRKTNQVVQHTWRNYAWVDEYAQLVGVKSRQGSTLAPELRSAWNGERLGMDYRAEETRLPVVAGSYRLAVAAGIQPGLVADVFRGADVGDLQRWLWWPTVDPALVDAPDGPFVRLTADELGLPDKVRSNAVSLTLHTTPGRLVMPIPDSVREAIRAKGRHRHGKGLLADDDHDSHRSHIRLRLAGICALMAGRFEVTEQDWDLAGRLMRVSDRTRIEAEKAMHSKAKRALWARGEAQAEVEAGVADASARRVAVTLGRAVAKHGPQTRKQLKDRIMTRDRQHLDSALEYATEQGWLATEQAPGSTGNPGTRYLLGEAWPG